MWPRFYSASLPMYAPTCSAGSAYLLVPEAVAGVTHGLVLDAARHYRQAADRAPAVGFGVLHRSHHKCLGDPAQIVHYQCRVASAHAPAFAAFVQVGVGAGALAAGFRSGCEFSLLEDPANVVFVVALLSHRLAALLGAEDRPGPWHGLFATGIRASSHGATIQTLPFVPLIAATATVIPRMTPATAGRLHPNLNNGRRLRGNVPKLLM